MAKKSGVWARIKNVGRKTLLGAGIVGAAVGGYFLYTKISDTKNVFERVPEAVAFVADEIGDGIGSIINQFNGPDFPDDGSGISIVPPGDPSNPSDSTLYVIEPSIVNQSFKKLISTYSEIPEGKLVLQGNGLFVGEESYAHWPFENIGVGLMGNPDIVSMVPIINYTLPEDRLIADPTKEPLIQQYPSGTVFNEEGKIPISFVSKLDLGDSTQTYVSAYPLVEISGLETKVQEIRIYPCIPHELIAGSSGIDPKFDCAALIDTNGDIPAQMKALENKRLEAYTRIEAEFFKDGILNTSLTYTPAKPGSAQLSGEAAYLAKLWDNGIFFSGQSEGTSLSLSYTPKTFVLLSSKPEVEIKQFMMGLADFRYSDSMLGIEVILNAIDDNSEWWKYHISDGNREYARMQVLNLPTVMAMAINRYQESNPDELVPYTTAGDGNYTLDPGAYKEPPSIPDLIQVLNQNNADLLVKYGHTISPAAVTTSDRACGTYAENCTLTANPAELNLCVNPSLVDGVTEAVARYQDNLAIEETYKLYIDHSAITLDEYRSIAESGGSALYPKPDYDYMVERGLIKPLYSEINVSTIDSCVSELNTKGITPNPGP